ncbi:MAG: hypothetical protein L6R42_011156, partial [Xanthoria sp. 1 TBL-2021]
EAAKAHKCRPIFDKTKTDHHHAPGKRDGGKPKTWAEEARQDRSWWLEDYVGDEEDECDDRLEMKSAVGALRLSVKLKGFE